MAKEVIAIVVGGEPFYLSNQVETIGDAAEYLGLPYDLYHYYAHLEGDWRRVPIDYKIKDEDALCISKITCFGCGSSKPNL